jgi:hypothetical protein
MNGCDGIVERRDKPLSLQEFYNKDATGLDMILWGAFFEGTHPTYQPCSRFLAAAAFI